MKLKEWADKTLPAVAEQLAANIQAQLPACPQKSFQLASRAALHATTDQFVGILLPSCQASQALALSGGKGALTTRLRTLADVLSDQLESAFLYQCEFENCQGCRDCRQHAEEAVLALLAALPKISAILQRDIQAAYDGDPAARSIMEIVMSYPCLQAIAIHRIAHQLYLKGVPLIPRIMSELAHSRTGIDIHPGAEIGSGFFIDHGTGVVIGETCIIGDNVKIYQGVTLGALSFPKDEHGNPAKGVKRHPEVRDNVTIYAGATILGGATVVGEGAVIGGNVWLTNSVPAHAKVYNKQPKPYIHISA